MTARLLTFAALLLSACSPRPEPVSPTTYPDSFVELAAQFNDPPAHFRSAPLWVWNDDIQESQISEQLRDFKEKGIGGVFVHPRPGLITAYLSDRWNELFRFTVDEARELGMLVWIYDENSYPSGFAGGHVPASMPESYAEGQALNLSAFSRLPASLDDSVVVALEQNGDAYEDITETWRSRAGEEGDFVLFTSSRYGRSGWYGGFSYVDLLRPGVTEKFLDVTMSAYEAAAGSAFGQTVPGIFTDEPHINPPGDIKYTPDLFEQFQKRWGYDLRPNLPALWFETGDWARVRHDYRALLLELFIERWAQPWNAFTEQRGLLWTGHYWEHGWPDPSHGPDNMAMYAWHQVPAIDILMNQYSEDVHAQFGNVRAAKEVISVANQMGRRRTLSETYGAGGWDLRFRDMKRIADWQYALGVNFVNQHLSYITIMGARKRDHPQSFSYHEPWWPYYRPMGDYLGRMSLALSSGRQENTTLVLEPTTTGWLYYTPRGDRGRLDSMGVRFQDFVTRLERAQIEYDLGSEDILARFGSVEGPGLRIGERTYARVVLPPGLENLESTTADLLATLLVSGGEVVSLAGIPARIDGSATDRLERLASAHPQRWVNASFPGDQAVFDLLGDPAFAFELPAEGNGILYHHRRRLSDGDLWLLTNSSQEEESQGLLRTNGSSVLKLDPTTGAITPYPFRRAGTQIETSFALPPVGALLLFVSPTPQAEPAEPAPMALPLARTLELTGPLAIQRTSPNALILDYCDVSFGEGPVLDDLYFYAAADTVFRHFGLEGNPWSRAVQYKRELVEKENFPPDRGFSATYRLQVGAGAPTDSLRIAVERPGLWEVWVNDSKVDPLPDTFWLDKAFGLYDAAGAITPGENRITLRAARMTIHSELEPIYVLGSFGAEPTAKGWRLVAPRDPTLGSWRASGWPMYTGGVSYTSSVVVADTTGRFSVHLPEWNGTVAAVRVNGTEAGIVAWPPNELDVTDSIRPGPNEVTVTVIGSLKNLLGPFHFSPPRGAAWPTQFEAGPAHQPGGATYDLIDYGLFAPFEVVQRGDREKV